MPPPIYNADDFKKLSIPTDGINITPSDSTDLTTPGLLYIGSGGTLIIRTRNGVPSCSFINIPNAFFFPINVSRVVSTGTTCTGIVALF